MKKIQLNDISGLIVLDKPKGFTSYDCLAVIKKYLHPKKIGHTGTLDVNATGVLVCLLGDATKFQDSLMKNGDKEYSAELILGLSTDTEDVTGKIVSFNERIIDLLTIDNTNGNEEIKILLDNVYKIAKSFIGEYRQIPPMYSAKKVAGDKLIDLARKGRVIERKPATVFIKSIDVKGLDRITVDFNGTFKTIYSIKLNVICSKGTYIRTLCKDIGEKLCIPSCMGNLRRIQTSGFKIENSISLEEIKEKVENNDYSFVRPCYFSESETIVTFGKFDTLHLGHQKIIRLLVERAKELNLKSVVMIVGDNVDNSILTRAERISKLKYLGVDNIYTYKLNYNNSNITAEYFVKEILIGGLKAKEIIVGSDCSFGKNGEGNKNFLLKVCNECDVDVVIVDKLKVDGTDVDISSTLLKAEYSKGNFEIVNRLIGKTN